MIITVTAKKKKKNNNKNNSNNNKINKQIKNKNKEVYISIYKTP